ncbi:GlsB/YeaQ/YmgE family stress response membrane protein [Patescibacteria group bacterium]|nr:GlsB/YeaQ/YmgE family stress response membrane protein [Patescibacteria group bacterium]
MPNLVISWIVLGAIAGLLVYLFSSKRLMGGMFGNIAIGVVGALAGGYLVTGATHADISSASLTWGILITSAASAVIVTIVFQSEATERVKK